MLMRLLFATLLATQGTTAQNDQPEQRYRVQRGDVLDLSFAFVPDFNQTVTVQPDGYVTLRTAGETQAEGLTLPELKTTVEAKYAGILREPLVSIEMKDFEKPFFLAQGQLGRPGKYDLRGVVTLSEAVAIAGGLGESARHSQVLLFRRSSADQVEVKQIDLKKMLNGKDLSQDVHLEPGDMVFIPKSRISQIKPFVPLPYFRFLIPGI